MSIPGPLTGGPQCRMSILRNDNVPCRYFCNYHVDFRIGKCRLSNLGKALDMSLIFFPMLIGSMSHVNFKKWLCGPVAFKGQGPLYQCTAEGFEHSGPTCTVGYSWHLVNVSPTIVLGWGRIGSSWREPGRLPWRLLHGVCLVLGAPGWLRIVFESSGRGTDKISY